MGFALFFTLLTVLPTSYLFILVVHSLAFIITSKIFFWSSKSTFNLTQHSTFLNYCSFFYLLQYIRNPSSSFLLPSPSFSMLYSPPITLSEPSLLVTWKVLPHTLVISPRTLPRWLSTYHEFQNACLTDPFKDWLTGRPLPFPLIPVTCDWLRVSPSRFLSFVFIVLFSSCFLLLPHGEVMAITGLQDNWGGYAKLNFILWV